MPPLVVEILISDWEIECCAPPPVLGDRSSWRLEFLAGTDEPAREHLWTVTHRDGAAVLDRDGVEAVWNDYETPAPPPGIQTLRGHLSGTVHGGHVPEVLPPVSGRVQRVRVASWELAWDPHRERTLLTVPGTLALRDVRESPRWFSHDGPGDGRHDMGVLIDLAVDPRRTA